MPTIQYDDGSVASVAADTVAVFAAQADQDRVHAGADARAAAEAMGIDLQAALGAVRFNAEPGTYARVPKAASSASGATALLVVGLGKEADVDLTVLRKAAGTAARNAAKEADLAVVVPGDLLTDGVDASSRARAVAEGAGLGAYAFSAYRSKTNDQPSLERIGVVAGEGLDAGAVADGVRAGEVLVRGASLARDLVNTPPGDKRPPALASRVAEIAQAAGLGIEVLDETALREGSFGGILGVGQGSSEPPRLVVLTYEPEQATGHVVLVGKGITFDSGGLSLKPSKSMMTMKSDMSGAAAVIGVMSVCGELGVRTKVTGLLALAENMPSGHAVRVSDVLTHHNGKTVEVMNTDAEGRLVLADALAYGAKSSPDAMIDLATLTGAQVVALGTRISGLMGTDDELVSALERAAADTGEPVWRLPLPEEYREHLDSEVADLKNIGRPGEAGTIVAGLFLKEFTDGVPWAHLDIAGPAFEESGDAHFLPKGGTGIGVRLLASYLLGR